MNKLTSENVQKTLMDCFFTEEEIQTLGEEELKKKAIMVEGITNIFGLNPDRLEQAVPTILEYVKQLHPNFMEEGEGGGWSFLNLPFDKDGVQWGEHMNAEQLYVLANAAGLAKFCMPRDMWKIFPGEMPYIVFRTEKT